VLSYQISQNHHLYAQYSEGFRPGFHTSPPPPICNYPPGALDVQSDSIKNYELGAKTSWMDRRLTVNMAVYRINWAGIQQQHNLTCTFSVFANFGDAVLEGAEVETNGQLTARVSAGVSASNIHTELQQDFPLLGSLRGDPVLSVPRWQYAVYGQTTFPIFEGNDGFARLDYQYTGSSFTNYSRLSDGNFDPSFEVRVVRLLNLRAGVRHHDWEIALSGTNLLNNTVRQSIDPSAVLTIGVAGRPRYVITRPRSFSLGATYQF